MSKISVMKDSGNSRVVKHSTIDTSIVRLIVAPPTTLAQEVSPIPISPKEELIRKDSIFVNEWEKNKDERLGDGKVRAEVSLIKDNLSGCKKKKLFCDLLFMR